jgi:hypothetical protein
VPSGYSVKVSSPGVEPGPRPSQSRVRIRHTPRTCWFSVPCSGIEPDLTVSKTVVQSGTLARRHFSSIPTWTRTRARTFGGSDANPLHHRDSVSGKSRRLDSHQHEPVYKTGAFLSRATSAKHEREESNPVRQLWRLTALPGAHSYRFTFQSRPALAAATDPDDSWFNCSSSSGFARLWTGSG